MTWLTNLTRTWCSFHHFDLWRGQEARILCKISCVMFLPYSIYTYRRRAAHLMVKSSSQYRRSARDLQESASIIFWNLQFAKPHVHRYLPSKGSIQTGVGHNIRRINVRLVPLAQHILSDITSNIHVCKPGTS